MECREDFRLVRGYLPEIDKLPETALKLGLRHRVSAVLNDSRTPHTPLYWDLIDAFMESLAPDGVTFEIDMDDGPLVFTSVASMRDYVVEAWSKIGGPFDRATFYVKGRANAFIDVEPHAVTGGPFPYYDAWTFAIYRETDDITSLREACHRVCTQHGVRVEAEIQGLVAPQCPPRWRRMLRWWLRW